MYQKRSVHSSCKDFTLPILLSIENDPPSGKIPFLNSFYHVKNCFLCSWIQPLLVKIKRIYSVPSTLISFSFLLPTCVEYRSYWPWKNSSSLCLFPQNASWMGVKKSPCAILAKVFSSGSLIWVDRHNHCLSSRPLALGDVRISFCFCLLYPPLPGVGQQCLYGCRPW